MYIIGDVHGCFDTLLALLDKLDLTKGICFVGDLIDRGPKSRQVVRYIKQHRHKFDCVKGNHEDMAVEAIDSQDFGLWLYNGGSQTVKSYDTKSDLLASHIEWFRQLPVIKRYKFEGHPDLIVSHSSATEYVNSSMNKAREYDVLWDRCDYPGKIKDCFNVFGHTIQKNGPLIKDHFACIDTGCFVKGYSEKVGLLTALEYPSLKIVQQINKD